MIEEQCMSGDDNTECPSRELLWHVTGDGGRGNAGQVLKWKPDPITHPYIPAVRTLVASRSGTTARGGAEAMVKTTTMVWQIS